MTGGESVLTAVAIFLCPNEIDMKVKIKIKRKEKFLFIKFLRSSKKNIFSFSIYNQ